MTRFTTFVKAHLFAILCFGSVGSIVGFLLLCPLAVWDTGFHLMRIESLAIHWQDHGFTLCRLYEASALGYGYASPLFYCDLTLYPFAFLRWFGVPLSICYSALLISVLGLAFLLMQRMCRWFGLTQKESFIAGLFYVMAPSFLLALLHCGQVGNLFATAFLPLLLFPWQVFLFEEKATPSRLRQATLLLTLGATLLILTHILSTIVVAVVLAPVALFRFKLLFRRERFLPLLIALFFTLGLTAWFWLPFLEQKMACHLWCFDRPTPNLDARWCHGIELFIPWRLTYYLLHPILPWLPKISEDTFALWGWFLLPLGFLLFKTRKQWHIATAPAWIKTALILIPLVLLFVTTKPTLWLLKQVMGWIQFPSRFFAVLACLAAPLVALFVTRICNQKGCRLLLLGLTLSALAACSCTLLHKGFLIAHGGSYQLSDTSFHLGLYEYSPTAWVHSVGNGWMSWETPPQKGDYGQFTTILTTPQTTVTVPRFYYKGYMATLDGQSCAITESPNGLLNIATNGRCGLLTVAYHGTPLQRYAFWLSIFTVLLFLLFLCRIIKRQGLKA